MDEICASVKTDPLEARLKHLRDERVIAVLKSAAESANWDPRPSPKGDRPRTGVATGRGIACVAYEGNNGYAALIANVEVNVETGQVKPKRFTVAVDCGPISNPDGLRNQTEGGILQGMSRALLEQVMWDDKRVTSTDWETYNSLYLGFEIPEINVVFINRTGVRATGAGETAITVVAAAVGNAIFDATGVRLREVPFTAERMKSALASENS
jgi:CO/xanthine dehydrogenase Mo-binding subunit